MTRHRLMVLSHVRNLCTGTSWVGIYRWSTLGIGSAVELTPDFNNLNLTPHSPQKALVTNRDYLSGAYDHEVVGADRC